MIWSAMGAMGLAFAVAFGAFGAHALKGQLDAYSAGIYEKAVFYHFVHALGLLAVSVLPKAGVISQNASTWVCALLLAGIVLFSGSLYVLSLTGITVLGAVTPLGGVAFLAGWLFMLLGVARSK